MNQKIVLDLDKGDNLAEVTVVLKRDGQKSSTVRVSIRGGTTEINERTSCYDDDILHHVEVQFSEDYTEVEQSGDSVIITPKRYPILCG